MTDTFMTKQDCGRDAAWISIAGYLEKSNQAFRNTVDSIRYCHTHCARSQRRYFGAIAVGVWERNNRLNGAGRQLFIHNCFGRRAEVHTSALPIDLFRKENRVLPIPPSTDCDEQQRCEQCDQSPMSSDPIATLLGVVENCWVHGVTMRFGGTSFRFPRFSCADFNVRESMKILPPSGQMIQLNRP
jgi:hypothetical protein